MGKYMHTHIRDKVELAKHGLIKVGKTHCVGDFSPSLATSKPEFVKELYDTTKWKLYKWQGSCSCPKWVVIIEMHGTVESEINMN